MIGNPCVMKNYRSPEDLSVQTFVLKFFLQNANAPIPPITVSARHPQSLTPRNHTARRRRRRTHATSASPPCRRVPRYRPAVPAPIPWF